MQEDEGEEMDVVIVARTLSSDVYAFMILGTSDVFLHMFILPLRHFICCLKPHFETLSKPQQALVYASAIAIMASVKSFFFFRAHSIIPQFDCGL